MRKEITFSTSLLSVYKANRLKKWLVCLTLLGANLYRLLNRQYGPRIDSSMFHKLANEHFIHTAVNTACIILSLSLFPPSIVVVLLCMKLMSSSACQKGSACSCGRSPRACRTPCFHGSPSGSTMGRLCARTPTTCFFFFFIKQSLLWYAAPKRASN